MAGQAAHKVVIVGGGFGGLLAATHLARAPVDLTLVDRRNFHLFQPLTYQVATGALSPSEVCYPLRAMFTRRRNVRVLMAEVSGFDLHAREVRIDPHAGGATVSLGYDTLIVAGASRYSYFGHDEWARVAPEVKSLESALAVRGRILGAFEEAELEPDHDRRRALLTFVVVGAGPTGVEMAGQIAELARDTLPDPPHRVSRSRGTLLPPSDATAPDSPPLAAEPKRSRTTGSWRGIAGLRRRSVRASASG